MEDDNILVRAMRSTFSQTLLFVFSVIVPAGTLAASPTVRHWINVNGVIVAGTAIAAVAFLMLYIDHLIRSLHRSAIDLKRTTVELKHVSNELSQARLKPTQRDVALYERFMRELAPDSGVIRYLKQFSGQRWHYGILMPLADFRIRWLDQAVFFDDAEVDSKRVQFLLAVEDFFNGINAEEGDEIREGSLEYRVKSPSLSRHNTDYEQVTRSLELLADRVLDAHSELLRTGRKRRL